MAEYIEREKLLQDISETVVFTVKKGTPLPNAEMRGANKVIDQIKSAPTVDVVKVVRCKDCGYCELRYPVKEIGKEAIEGYFCYLNQKYVKATDFCSYGELKECKK